MFRYILAWLGAGVAIGGLDFFWLTTTNATVYRPVLHSVLLDGVRPVPAGLFYLIYLVGVVIFGVGPGIRSGRWRDATAMGGLFGFFAYATYDLTNQATLRNWTTSLTLADLAWGTLLSTVAASLGYLAGRAVG